MSFSILSRTEAAIAPGEEAEASNGTNAAFLARHGDARTLALLSRLIGDERYSAGSRRDFRDARRALASRLGRVHRTPRKNGHRMRRAQRQPKGPGPANGLSLRAQRQKGEWITRVTLSKGT